MAAQSKPVQKLTPFTAALAGALSGCFSNAVVYPLDVVKTRIQAAHTDRDPADRLAIIPLLMRILKEEGLAGYFKGFSATMLNTFSMQYAYFYFYSFVRSAYIKRITKRLPKGAKVPALGTVAELLLGAVAGALAQIFTLPVAVIATRQQVGRSPAAKARRREISIAKAKANALVAAENGEGNGSGFANGSACTSTSRSVTPVEVPEEKEDDSFLGVAHEIIEEEGVTGLWLGIKPGLVLTVNPAITYGVYERLKGMLLTAQGATSNHLSPWWAFLLGATSKTLATVVTYPYIMAKVRIQARSADADTAEEDHNEAPMAHKRHHTTDHHVGALDILARVWRHQGFRGWYQGMSAQIVKAVLSQGVLFMSKDQFEKWALIIMAMWYRLQLRQ